MKKGSKHSPPLQHTLRAGGCGLAFFITLYGLFFIGLNFFGKKYLYHLCNIQGHTALEISSIGGSLLDGSLTFYKPRFTLSSSQGPYLEFQSPKVVIRLHHLLSFFDQIELSALVQDLDLKITESHFPPPSAENPPSPKQKSPPSNVLPLHVTSKRLVFFSLINVDNAQVRFLPKAAAPDQKPVEISHLNVVGENLPLVGQYEALSPAPTSIRLSTKGLETESFQFEFIAKQMTPVWDFDLRLKVSHLNLPTFNFLFQREMSIDFEKGTVDLMVDLHYQGNKYQGFTKTTLRDVEVFSWSEDVEKEGDSLLKVFWENLVGTVGEILENQPENQLATKKPFQGTLEQPETSEVAVILDLLQKAFLQAIMPEFEKK